MIGQFCVNFKQTDLTAQTAKSFIESKIYYLHYEII